MISGPSNIKHEELDEEAQQQQQQISLRLKIRSKVLLIIVCNFRDRLMNQMRAIDGATKVDGWFKEDIKVVEKDLMGGSQVKKVNNATETHSLSDTEARTTMADIETTFLED